MLSDPLLDFGRTDIGGVSYSFSVCLFVCIYFSFCLCLSSVAEDVCVMWSC